MGQDSQHNMCFDLLWYVGLFYMCYLSIKILFASIHVFKVYVWAQLIARHTDRKLPSKYGRWAVVTGSTDGIGKVYAKELAKAGHDIILISRNLEKLQKVAAEIKNEFGVETEVIQADFSHGRTIYEGIGKQLEGKEIGILVNNVGTLTADPLKFGDVPEDDMWRMIIVNTTSVAAMTQLVLPAMLVRRKGAIINIASVADGAPIPFLQIYSATKAFVSYLTQAMQFEYRSSGLTIQHVRPGIVLTNMANIYGEMLKTNPFVPSAETYVRNAMSTLGHTGHTNGYWAHALQDFMMHNLPSWLVFFVMEKTTGVAFHKDPKVQSN